MSRLTGPAVLMVVMMSSPGLMSALDNATVEVFYPQASIRVPRGSSVLLSCETLYNLLQCDALHAAWHKHEPQPVELNDPRKFFTTVNETERGGNQRRRRVVTEILEVRAEDAGRFQCRAECPEETAMGHFISLSVEG